jgi:pyridoxine 4-dehydrogenase
VVSGEGEGAAKKGCTPAQLALSWIKTQSALPGMPVIVPVAGARSEERVAENATGVDLSSADLEEIRSVLDKSLWWEIHILLQLPNLLNIKSMAFN